MCGGGGGFVGVCGCMSGCATVLVRWGVGSGEHAHRLNYNQNRRCIITAIITVHNYCRGGKQLILCKISFNLSSLITYFYLEFVLAFLSYVQFYNTSTVLTSICTVDTNVIDLWVQDITPTCTSMV